ncbi:zinc ion binding [Ascochyta rabiei]|uniref:Zinc ion binding n=1 Tax=Didymella rabiei TaxID=5454 RepID=A0A163MBN3_DIDRA|nr:zinc ion binding [Ascochyta rabiei]
MESIAPGPLSAAARTFIEKHTEVDLEISRFDECPICLEAYATSFEQSVRIREILGCSHVLGFNCLKQILRSGPQQGKKCPLCRTQWLAPTCKGGHLPALTPTLGRSYNPFQTAYLHAAQVAERQTPTTAASRRPGSAIEASPITSANVRFPRSIPRRSLAEQAAEDEAFRTQLNSYNSFRHDIQNIRTRANGRRPLLRSPRPLNTSSRLMSDLRENEQPGRSSTATVRSHVPRIRSFRAWRVGRVDLLRDEPDETMVNPRPHSDVPCAATSSPTPGLMEALISPGHNSSLHIQEGSSTILPNHDHALSRTPGDEPSLDSSPLHLPSSTTHDLPAYHQPNVEPCQNMSGTGADAKTASRLRKINESGNTAEDLSSSSSEAPNTSTGTIRILRSRSPHPRSLNQEDERRTTRDHLRVHSHPRDMHEEHVRLNKRKTLHENRLNARQILLSSSEAATRVLEQSVRNREQTLTVREREVSSREEQVVEREKRVLVREQRMDVQQQSLERAMGLIMKHRDELREMIERQQQELARVLGGG